MRSVSIAAWLLTLVCILVSPALAGPGQAGAVIADARTWLTLIDNGRYEESWSEASALFRGAMNAKEWGNSLTNVRKPLGALISRKKMKTTAARQLPGAPDGHYLVMVFETSFKNKKAATETVTFMRETDGRWKAAGYYIR